MIKLIVTADDYGKDCNCNAAIAECMRRGWITQTSLMVNMPNCEDAVDIARKEGFLDRIGLHINLTQGCPLTDGIRQSREFCNESGEFNGAFRRGLRRSYSSLTPTDEKMLECEIRAQAERYIALGLPVRHFDSHHHSHTFWRVIPGIFGILRDCGFTSARSPLNMAVRHNVRAKIYYPLEEKLKLWRMRAYDMAHTDYMGGLEGFAAYFATMKDGSSAELMVHPMYMHGGKLDMAGEISDSGLRLMSETAAFVESKRNVVETVSVKEWRGL